MKISICDVHYHREHTLVKSTRIVKIRHNHVRLEVCEKCFLEVKPLNVRQTLNYYYSLILGRKLSEEELTSAMKLLGANGVM
jgi:hypothetical protein